MLLTVCHTACGESVTSSYHTDSQCHTDLFLTYFADCADNLLAVGFLAFAEF